jgi:Ca2+-binding RTX toxin-like protein
LQFGGAGPEVLVGTAGNDTLLSGAGDDTLYGAPGNDFLRADGGADIALGGLGNDTLYGGSAVSDPNDDAKDLLYGDTGSDWLYGNGGGDVLLGGDGADTLYGGFGNDSLYGGADSDSITDGNDWIAAGPGADSLRGGFGNDTLFGGSGIIDSFDAADTVEGGAGNDILYGNGGADSLAGGDGADTLYGGAGDDDLNGDSGADVIVAGLTDTVTGGGDSDRFILDAATLTNSQALVTTASPPLLHITDMEIGDRLQLINLNGRAASVTQADGETLILINGTAFATLEGVTPNQIVSVGQPILPNATEYVLSGTSFGGGTVASNTAPILNSLNSPAAFLENTLNTTPQLIDNNVDFSDDNANLNGGNLTVSITAGGSIDDQLFIRNQGNGAGQIGVTPGSTIVRYGGTQIGTVAGGTNGNNLVVTFNASATPAAIEALIENLTYANNSDSPSASRTISITVNDAILTSTAATAVITVTAEADPPPSSPSSVALSSLNGTTGYRLDGVGADDRAGFAVAGIGDVNGDGFEDVVIGAYNADNNALSNSGSSYVVFGKASGYASSLDLSTLDGTTGFRLDGEAATNFAGYDLSAAGDVNGDGYDDIWIGADGHDPGGRNNAGTGYIIFGKASGWAATVALSSLDGTTGMQWEGIDAGDRAGAHLSAAGDVNGDGFEDLLIGSYRGDPGGDVDAGESYVIFGKSSGWAANAVLSTLDGTNGFRLDGIDSSDFSGWDVGYGGDVNGDGLSDLVIGAYRGDPGGDADAGESYVIFGKTGAYAASLDLSTLDGTTGYRLDGKDPVDRSGYALATAGDINGDGFDELVIGARLADPAGGDSGESYVIFGKASGYGASFDLGALNGTNGFRLTGIDGSDQSGHSVASAGDFNGDGLSDLLVSARQGDPGGNNQSGETYIIFGKTTAFATNISLSTLSGTDGFRLDGIDAADFSGESVSSAGDVNGDGFDDLIVGAPQGDPGGDLQAGESYIIFGNNSGAVTRQGTSNDDTMSGTAAADVIIGGLGNDSIAAGNGNNVVKGANGNDYMVGGTGIDRLYGGNGNDTMYGNDNNDFIYGGDGADWLHGVNGNDYLVGGNGNDRIYVGTGADTAIGGLGDDLFRFSAGHCTSTALDVFTLNFDQDDFDIEGVTVAANSITAVGSVTANTVADVVAAYSSTNMDRIGDANDITVTGGTLAGTRYIILSTDGNAAYNEGVDLFFRVIATGTFDVGDIE